MHCNFGSVPLHTVEHDKKERRGIDWLVILLPPIHLAAEPVSEPRAARGQLNMEPRQGCKMRCDGGGEATVQAALSAHVYFSFQTFSWPFYQATPVSAVRAASGSCGNTRQAALACRPRRLAVAGKPATSNTRGHLT